MQSFFNRRRPGAISLRGVAITNQTMPKQKPNDLSYQPPEEYLIPRTAGWAVAMRQVDPAWWPNFEAFVQAMEEEE